MNEKKLQDDLVGIFYFEDKNGNTPMDELEIKSVSTYDETGILTNDSGIILTMNDGSEFFLTIKKR